MCSSHLGHCIYHAHPELLSDSSASLRQPLPIPGSVSLPDPTLPRQNKQCTPPRQSPETEAESWQLAFCSLLTNVKFHYRMTWSANQIVWSLSSSHMWHLLQYPLTSPFPTLLRGGQACDSPGLGSSCAHHWLWIPEICSASLTETWGPFTHQLSLSRCQQANRLPTPSLPRCSLDQKKV